MRQHDCKTSMIILYSGDFAVKHFALFAVKWKIHCRAERNLFQFVCVYANSSRDSHVHIDHLLGKRYLETICMFSSRRYFASAVTVKLRPYQESCLEACKNALQAGATRIGVSLPTGAGKTTVFISLLAQISPPSHSPSVSRSLIIVNSIELARQSAAQAAAQFPQWRVEIEQGVKHQASGNADVYVLVFV